MIYARCKVKVTPSAVIYRFEVAPFFMSGSRPSLVKYATARLPSGPRTEVLRATADFLLQHQSVSNSHTDANCEVLVASGMGAHHSTNVASAACACWADGWINLPGTRQAIKVLYNCRCVAGLLLGLINRGAAERMLFMKWLRHRVCDNFEIEFVETIRSQLRG
jgi:hypothetical protein